MCRANIEVNRKITVGKLTLDADAMSAEVDGEDDRDIEAGLINEKETVCNKSASDSVFGGSSIFLKNENVIFGRKNHSCVWRVCSASLVDKRG